MTVHVDTTIEMCIVVKASPVLCWGQCLNMIDALQQLEGPPLQSIYMASAVQGPLHGSELHTLCSLETVSQPDKMLAQHNNNINNHAFQLMMSQVCAE